MTHRREKQGKAWDAGLPREPLPGGTGTPQPTDLLHALGVDAAAAQSSSSKHPSLALPKGPQCWWSRSALGGTEDFRMIMSLYKTPFAFIRKKHIFHLFLLQRDRLYNSSIFSSLLTQKRTRTGVSQQGKPKPGAGFVLSNASSKERSREARTGRPGRWGSHGPCTCSTLCLYGAESEVCLSTSPV